MKKKKIKNPLIRRIPRELLGDWKKYLVVALFLILTIGFVSGMYVANESMLIAANEGVTKYKLEDGHFELDKKADETLLTAIETGTKADVKKYYLDKAKKELDEKLDEKAYPEAYDEAWDKIVEEIDDKYADAEEKYELNDPDFTEVPVQVYENFSEMRRKITTTTARQREPSAFMRKTITWILPACLTEHFRKKRMRSQLTVCMQTMSESKWEMRFLSAGRGSKLSD